MDLIYKKIVEIRIRHDYYLAWDEDDPTTTRWLDSYSILNDLDIIPTPACSALMKDQKIVFRKIPTGFVLLARVQPSDANVGAFNTFVFFEDLHKLDFLIRVRNPEFYNFTNIRLLQNKGIYYFNNLDKTTLNSTLFLTLNHPAVSNGATDLLLGDLVVNGGNLYEVNKNIPSSPGFNPANNEDLGTYGTKYVSHQDYLRRQFPNYIYTEPNNTHPGEILTFTLFDINGNAVSLGNTPNTDFSQSRYQAPLKASDSLHHTIDLSGIRSGRYTMKINKASGVIDQPPFYLFDPLVYQDVFGIIELFPYASGANFLNPVSSESEILPPGADLPVFHIRFKNRSTVWQYYDKAERLFANDNEPYLPLTQQFTKHQIDGAVVPDPTVAMIYPEQSGGQVEKIYSKIYLQKEQ